MESTSNIGLLSRFSRIRRKPQQPLTELTQLYSQIANATILYISLEEKGDLKGAYQGWRGLNTNVLYQLKQIERNYPNTHLYTPDELSLRTGVMELYHKSLEHLERVTKLYEKQQPNMGSLGTVSPRSQNGSTHSSLISSSTNPPTNLKVMAGHSVNMGHNLTSRGSKNLGSPKKVKLLKTVRDGIPSKHAGLRGSSLAAPTNGIKAVQKKPKATHHFEGFDEDMNLLEFSDDEDNRGNVKGLPSNTDDILSINQRKQEKPTEDDIFNPEDYFSQYLDSEGDELSLEEEFKELFLNDNMVSNENNVRQRPPPPIPPKPRAFKSTKTALPEMKEKHLQEERYPAESTSSTTAAVMQPPSNLNRLMPPSNIQSKGTAAPSPSSSPVHKKTAYSGSSTSLTAAIVCSNAFNSSQNGSPLSGTPPPNTKRRQINHPRSNRDVKPIQRNGNYRPSSQTATNVARPTKARQQILRKSASQRPTAMSSPSNSMTKQRPPKNHHIAGSATTANTPVPSLSSTPQLGGHPEEAEEGVKETLENDIIDSLRGVDKNAAKQIFSEIVVRGDEVHWDDISGLYSAKNSLKEAVVYPFLRPDLFRGLREPVRGMLLFGPPGTGKTMLARAVATESHSTFFSISASSLTSKFLGESEKLVRALFAVAKKLSPSIIFVDEIDSILGTRNNESENEASRRIKNEFLVQWSSLSNAAAGNDGGDEDERVLVLAATNLPWSIDEAARRRFVRRQYIPLPEGETRKLQIVRLLANQKHTLTDESLSELVKLTDGYSGSDITSLAKDAAMGPLRELGDKLLMTPTEHIRPIDLTDFINSLNYIKPSVSREGLAHYEQWAEKFGSSGV